MASWLRWKSCRLLIIRRKDQDLDLEFVLAAFDILFLSVLCLIHNDSHEILQHIFWFVVFFLLEHSGSLNYYSILIQMEGCPQSQIKMRMWVVPTILVPSFPHFLWETSLASHHNQRVLSHHRVDTLPSLKLFFE